MLSPDPSSAAGKAAKMLPLVVSSFWGLHWLAKTASRELAEAFLGLAMQLSLSFCPFLTATSPPPPRHPRCGSQERSLTSRMPIWTPPAAQRAQLLQLVDKERQS